jgi:putative transposase
MGGRMSSVQVGGSSRNAQTLKWVDWFDNRSLLEPIGYIPPVEAKERCYAQFNALDMVA